MNSDPTDSTTDVDPPLRGEPFSAEHLKAFAEQLAASQKMSTGRGDGLLADRFADNCRFVANTYRVVTTAAKTNEEPIGVDAEWLADNYYVVKEQLREIREDLPRKFYRQLPKLSAGPWAGAPRIYELGHEFVVHTDSSLDEESIVAVVSAYQHIVPLTSGEVWAIPIMLRLVLTENLRRLCSHILLTRVCRRRAQAILAELETGQRRVTLPSDQACSILVMELIECLRAAPPQQYQFGIHELAERLGQPQERLDECVRMEQQRLAANQVSIGNVITSMRLLSALDWTLFFERVSLVEQILRRDPAKVYASMDFATRDLYRHRVERLAKRSRHEEIEVASAALDLAHATAHAPGSDDRTNHIGYYLVDAGRFALEKNLSYQPSLREWLIGGLKRRPALYYFGSVGLMSFIALWVLIAAMQWRGYSLSLAAAVALLAAIPVSELAISLVNAMVTIAIRPQLLPKLEFIEQIPAGYRSLVVVPALFIKKQTVQSLLERLEIHYLANPELGLTFALLTDFTDAPAENMPEDAELLSIARDGIEELNKRHAEGESRRFYLLHRRRKWNPVDKIWMGWERKRGKLLELSRWLRGENDTSFLDAEGVVQLRDTKYVVTLDADTRLPHAAARRLVGTLAHPLNQPHFDATKGRVTQGYGIVQPRVSVSLASANRSLFARIFAPSAGLDPYCTAVSDMYQDLFGEGSYTGKGIYDVDAFIAATAGVLPENHILSHDLIEGCYARVGLATDVEVFDDFPARLYGDVQRQHRWIRGDWQLLPWLGWKVPSTTGLRRNPLTFLSRWKIFDNLRRSLVPATLLLLLLLGWYGVPATAELVTLTAVLCLASPLNAFALHTLATWRPGSEWDQTLPELFWTVGRTLAQCVLTLIWLPLKAQYTVDAVIRTLYRLLVSRRNLLEWESADATERRLKRDSRSPVWKLAWVPILALFLAALLPTPARAVALPLIAGWVVSPAIADFVSRQRVLTPPPLTPKERQALRRIARRTWSFFEAFVGPQEHWLPPDNHQEFPEPKNAARISPTNEGLFILSAVAARDLGYIGVGNLITLLERNVDSFARLTRYRGQFFNWYDTASLRPLTPRYISTADSGNLAACLLTAQQALDDVVTQPLLGAVVAEGAVDSVCMVQESLAKLQPRGARFVNPALDDLEKQLASVREIALADHSDLLNSSQLLQRLKDAAAGLPGRLAEFTRDLGLAPTELSRKMDLLAAHLDGLYFDATSFAPWIWNLLPQLSTKTMQKPASLGSARPPISCVEFETAWRRLLVELDSAQSLQHLSGLAKRLATTFHELRETLAVSDLSGDAQRQGKDWLDRFVDAVDAGSRNAAACADRYRKLAERFESMALEMDFTLLYNHQRRLFHVGYNLEDGKPDRAHYDLLASESRIASLVAIAKGDVDHRHWFQLGRALTRTSAGGKGLLSWGGTMFEFLMPTLFTRDVEGSLLEKSCRAAVRRQIAYGRQRRVPWGISESAFAAQGTNSDYQYQSFGVPGLGLKQGLGKDLVVSPYSTALAAMIDAPAAVANFRALSADGVEGPWGCYDAVDYTPERIPEGERRAVVYCYMVHHQGMMMAALVNCLFDSRMQQRFERQPLARAIALLLQERIPVSVLQFQPRDDSVMAPPPLPLTLGPVSRRIATPTTSVPRAHLLSNGNYSVMVTNSGAGYSSHDATSITRWRSDATRDDWGQFIYLREPTTGKVWSAGYQPTRVVADVYEVTFSIDKAEFRRIDRNIESHLEIAISPEHGTEVRQLTLKNHSKNPVTLEVTSYAELVLSAAAADAAHPAFNKLFVETEYLHEYRALLATRRPRDAAAASAWAVHVLATLQASTETWDVEYETDRAQFIGRGRSLKAPAAMEQGAKLSATTGAVLDPIFSLRSRMTIAPDASTQMAFVTAWAESREQAIQFADQYRDPRVVLRTFEMAWAHSKVELRHLHITGAALQLYQRLASAILFPSMALRAPVSVLRENRLGQRSLWRYGISGDDPIVLVRLAEPAHRGLLREVLLAQEFWNAHGLKVDIVVVNEHPAGYFDEFQDQLLSLIQTTTRLPLNKSGGVYLLRASQLTPEDSVLLQAVASINLQGNLGTLSRQVDAAPSRPAAEPPKLKTVSPTGGAAVGTVASEEPSPTLDFSNGCGGFNEEGDYAIRLRAGQTTPLPWSNVIANERFGTLVTESGGGYTWAENSRENKLTTWSNDPVLDSPGEIIYLRDEESGQFWTPTPLPIRDEADYSINHRRGSTQFVHSSRGIRSELLISIAPDACVKFLCVKLQNKGQRPRSLSVTYYAEWVLGVHRQQTQMHVHTERDEATGALLVRNCYHEDFPHQVAFLQIIGGADSVTGDRTEFIGRNGSEANPSALRRFELAGTTGAGFDPCGAVQKKIKLAAGDETEVICVLGWGDDLEAAGKILSAYQSPFQVHQAIDQTTSFWQRDLAKIEVKTPDRALDLIVNHWLLYQTLSCRVWGRSAFYQAGGAYGFRDQLQDSMALVYAFPQIARGIILQAASRQFEPGDVQHWWHPPTGRGVRTRFADDYLWLPFVTSHYIATTGDSAILDEQSFYLQSPPLEDHEDERYELPGVAALKEDLYHHCVRAIDHAFRFGAHGLPLMGAGDWNDGMNKVGSGGRGESVWMAWFLRVVLLEFISIVERRGDHERAAIYRSRAEELLRTTEREAWDGAWYRRAFFDDGTPLGSSQNEECRIDSLAQSWAVLAGADIHRAEVAMQSVEEHLVRAADRLVLLLEPPFDKSALNPGYIKGYPPGIRENGGQYTHAAMWVIQALTKRGHGDRAGKVLSLINPILSASSASQIERYKVEPYVVAADVYSNSQHVGRGGWTWYTGSAAWMYRVALESILGLQLRGDHLKIEPCIPADWPNFEITIRRGATECRIQVTNPTHVESGVRTILVDQLPAPSELIPLFNDGKTHHVEVTMGVKTPGNSPKGLPSSKVVDAQPVNSADVALLMHREGPRG
jgi:cyclic beta-1,2-glucan synthetase